MNLNEVGDFPASLVSLPHISDGFSMVDSWIVGIGRIGGIGLGLEARRLNPARSNEFYLWKR